MISGILVLLMIAPGSPAQLKWPLEYIVFAIWVLLGFIGYRWRRITADLSKDEIDYQILGDNR